MSLTASVHKSEIDALHRALEDYARVAKKDITEVVAKKANDVRIALIGGFSSKRFGGSGKGNKKPGTGIAFREFRARVRAGRGVKLRPGLSASSARNAPETSRKGRPLNLHQRLVYAELALRQRGSGVLGAAFISKRWRFAKSKGPRVDAGGVRSAFGAESVETADRRKVIGRMTLGEAVARIEGLADGHGKVADRYGIIDAALRGVRADTEVFLARRARESVAASLRNAGLRAR